MARTKLQIDQLDVSSFSVLPESNSGALMARAIEPVIELPDPNDPTKATYCYICPGYTTECPPVI